MVVVTGAYGFIGSCMIGHLNKLGIHDIIAVDDLTAFNKTPNLIGKKCCKVIDRALFLDWFKENPRDISFVFHLGARTDTTETDYRPLEKLNVEYSKSLYKLCEKRAIPFLYASSAATYGDGELGFSDAKQENVLKLKPLNPYGISKNEFDKWLYKLSKSKPQNTFWAGFKFFNVYGPNEYHKGRMASTVYHFYHQILKERSVNLFESHKKQIANGEQQRDFIYIRDVLNILEWFMKNHKIIPSGIYNVGTGKALSFNDVVKNVFQSMNVPEKIAYIPTPKDIRDNYQYFTEADTRRLRNIAGYTKSFTSLEEGIEDYVTNYLRGTRYL